MSFRTGKCKDGSRYNYPVNAKNMTYSDKRMNIYNINKNEFNEKGFPIIVDGEEYQLMGFKTYYNPDNNKAVLLVKFKDDGFIIYYPLEEEGQILVDSFMESHQDILMRDVRDEIQHFKNLKDTMKSGSVDEEKMK